MAEIYNDTLANFSAYEGHQADMKGVMDRYGLDPVNDSHIPMPTPLNCTEDMARDFFQKRDWENVSTANLHPYVTTNSHQIYKKHKGKENMLKALAITMLVFYLALAIAGIITTGIFCPWFAVPIVGVGAMALTYPILKGYQALVNKSLPHKKVAHVEKGVHDELMKLDQLSDSEYFAQYHHLNPFYNRTNIDEVAQVAKEFGNSRDLFKPLIARYKFWENQYEEAINGLDALRFEYTEACTKIVNKHKNKKKQNELLEKVQKNALIQEHQQQNLIALAKAQAAFNYAILRDPFYFKDRTIEDVCSFNSLPYAEYKQASSLDPFEQAVWKTSANFIRFKDQGTYCDLDRNALLYPGLSIEDIATYFLGDQTLIYRKIQKLAHDNLRQHQKAS